VTPSVAAPGDTRAGLTIWGAPYQRKAEGDPFLICIPRIFSLGVHFSSPKKLTTFFLVVREHQHSMLKN